MNSLRSDIKLFTAPSKLVPGCVGLYTLQNIPKDTQIIEYTGEYQNEDCEYDMFLTDINEHLCRSYGFDIHQDESIDAINVGNILRFSNQSHKGYANCTAIVWYRNREYRNVLKSVEYISANSELVFDYGITKDLSWLREYNKRYLTNKLKKD